MRFRWNDWNVGHIATHGVTPDEAEHVVTRARPPWPRREGNGKYRVRGRSADLRWLQAIYIFSPPGTVYVIHARPLTDREKQQERRRTR